MNKNLSEQSLTITLIFPLLLILYEVSIYLSNDMYLPALPQIIHGLHASRYWVQLTISSWFLGAVSLQLILGPISDRFGRRPVLLLSGLMFVITTIICATTHHIGILLVARFFEGMGVCAISVAGYACIHELFDHKKAIQTLAWMGSIVVLAPAMGPLLGSLVLHFGDWRFIFWILAISAGTALLLLLKFMPETNISPTQLRFKPVLKNYGQLLLNQKFILNILISGLIFGGIICWITAGPLLVITEFKYAPFYFGLFQALVFGSYIIGTQCIKLLIEKFNTPSLILSGLSLLFLGGIASVIVSYIFPHLIIPFIVTLIFFEFGSGFIFAPLNRTIIESSEKPMGVKMALTSVISTGFGALASAFTTVFYNGTLLMLATTILGLAFIALMTYLYLKLKFI